MVKLVAIAGSIGKQSYNRMLLEFIRDHFKKQLILKFWTLMMFQCLMKMKIIMTIQWFMN